MAVSLQKARDYVYSNGVLWERALFRYLFEDGPIAYLHQCLRPYKNQDGGWHSLEHDITTPDSHPLALEFLLTTLNGFSVPIGNLLERASAWVEANRNEDGSLKNPPSVLEYPHAPWWNGGGQTHPDSITGNLIKHELASPSLQASTRRWVEANLNVEKIHEVEWLFMNYHAYDYFMNVIDFPDLERHRQATLENIAQCAINAPENQCREVFRFAPTPDSPVAQMLPAAILRRHLDHLQESQQDDGHWADEHNLPQWMPLATIGSLYTLRNFDRLPA